MSEKKLTALNLMQCIELRMKYKSIGGLKPWKAFRAVLDEIQREAHEASIPDHLVIMDNELIFMEIVKRSNLKPIYDDCYHAVESFQFQTSK